MPLLPVDYSLSNFKRRVVCVSLRKPGKEVGRLLSQAKLVLVEFGFYQ